MNTIKTKITREIETFLENKNSLIEARKTSLNYGGFNSYGYGYDRGYLACFFQAETLLQKALDIINESEKEEDE